VINEPDLDDEENMSSNIQDSHKRLRDEEETYHIQVKVEPVKRSLRQRKQVRYADEDESMEPSFGVFSHSSVEEPSSLPVNSKKNF
jgi:hypothetical protein